MSPHGVPQKFRTIHSHPTSPFLNLTRLELINPETYHCHTKNIACITSSWSKGARQQPEGRNLVAAESGCVNDVSEKEYKSAEGEQAQSQEPLKIAGHGLAVCTFRLGNKADDVGDDEANDHHHHQQSFGDEHQEFVGSDCGVMVSIY